MHVSRLKQVFSTSQNRNASMNTNAMPHEGFQSTVPFPFLNSSPAIMIIWTFLCLNWDEILSRVLSTGHIKEQVMVWIMKYHLLTHTWQNLFSIN